jgi:nucleotide-binding universal stress UspA family protein
LALNHGIAIARHYGSKIHLVHALEAPSHASSPHTAAIWGHGGVAQAEPRLREQAAQCTGIECSEWVLKGTPLEVVERIVSFDKVDLVVIGIHSTHGYRKVTMGSAAEHFFRHIHCPVLAIGPCVGSWQSVWEPKHMLLVTDLQSNESATVRLALMLAAEHDAALSLLHVAPPASAPFPDDQQVTARPYFEARLRELLSYKSEPQHRVAFLVEFSEEPITEILRAARERETDLILLSVHREEPWGLHLAHEAYRMVAEAPCPILIIQRPM